MSLYQQLGGGEAIQVALDLFYEKVMVDPRVSVYFDGLDVERVKRKQKAFLTMAFGGPARYDGRTLRAAHRRAVEQGLDREGFDVFMGLFRDTLDELDVPDELAAQVMEIAYGGRADVLGEDDADRPISSAEAV